MTIRTHPSYPLTDANRLLYKRIQRARRKRKKTQDQAERLEATYQIGKLTQEIRKLGMK